VSGRYRGAAAQETLAALAATRAHPELAGLTLFAHALPPDDPQHGRLSEIQVVAGESVQELEARLELSGVVSLLLAAGYSLVLEDGSTAIQDEHSTATGVATWLPAVPLPRLHDSDKNPIRRLRAQAAVAAVILYRLRGAGIDPSLIRQVPERGTPLKHGIGQFVADHLDDGWDVLPEIQLRRVYGLHMRKDVADRSTDISVIGPPNRRLYAIISSKASWRSDRGTEAAQLIPLRRYRPDVPYAVVTGEFPRVETLIRESPEDRVYHLAPECWSVWKVVQSTPLTEAVPRLPDLLHAGDQILRAIELNGLNTLVENLRDAGEVL